MRRHRMSRFPLGVTLAAVLCAALSTEAAEPLPTDVIARVCRVPKGQSAKTCDEPAAQLVWAEKSIPGGDGGECVARFKVRGKNPCFLPEYIAPWNGATMDYYLREATKRDPSLCCRGVGGADGVLDVVVSESDEGPFFDLPRDTIRGGSEGVLVISNVDGATHEFGHAVISTLNPEFALATEINERRGVSDPVSSPLQEGLADAITAGLSLYTRGAYGTAEPWVIGDAPSGTQSGGMISLPQALFRRDLRIPRRFLDTLEFDSPELARVVYGNFFFRAAQSGAFKPDELLLLTLGVTKALKDSPTSPFEGYDAGDFIDAVQAQYARFSSAQRTALTSIIVGMSSTGPAPGPAPGRPVPPPPTNLRRTADLGCRTFDPDVGPVSLYRMQWDPSPGALSYDLYVRENGSAFRFVNPIAGPIADLITNASSAEFKVAACNMNGCSPLSAGSVTVNNRLCPTNN
jgi:hypothetical protein